MLNHGIPYREVLVKNAALSPMDQCNTMSQFFAKEGVAYGTLRTSWYRLLRKRPSGSIDRPANRLVILADCWAKRRVLLIGLASQGGELLRDGADRAGL